MLKAQNVEVAVKKYKKGEYESIHYHKVVAEISATLQDTIIVVVKHPGEDGNKYIGKMGKEEQY